MAKKNKDEAREWTDEQLEEMEKKISDVYKESMKDITQKWDEFMERTESKVSGYRDAYNAAVDSGDADAIKKAKQKLEDVVRNQTFGNDRYKAMIDNATNQIAKANQTAIDYMNNKLPAVYSHNYNYIDPDVQKIIVNTNMNFHLVDEATIRRRIKDGDIRLPYKDLDKIKDQRWNTKQLNSQVLQGIIQGESMDKIARRILPIVNNNRSAAIRNARTMVTGAENEGRLDRYENLQDEGLVMGKVWIATGDDRTRDWHLSMDGQEVEIDEPFIDGLGNELMYPGDPSGEPETVYNCRCSMKSHVIGFRDANGNIISIDDFANVEQLKEEETPEVSIPTIEETKKFDTGREASEYFRGDTYDSKMGTTGRLYGYNVSEDPNKPATKWQNKLTFDQAQCIEAYTGDQYDPINKYLRDIYTKKEASDELYSDYSLNQFIKHMDAGIKKYNLQEPITVYRTCDREFLDQLNSNTVFHDKGYGSTSVLSKVVASGDVHFEIDVPAGKGIGAYVDGVSWKEGEEYEFLIGRGADYYVEKIEERKDGIYVKATVIGLSPDKI